MTSFRKSKKGALVPGRMRRIRLIQKKYGMAVQGKRAIHEKRLQLRVKLQPKSYDAVSNAALLASPLCEESRRSPAIPVFPNQIQMGPV
ncbi:hypothetical protein CLOLEP_02297 [[Clostridium] leptum DSM 753]|nr:hypothetical protein CLOLEP_02297 [[Clostridium] leptum DSM 753]